MNKIQASFFLQSLIRDTLYRQITSHASGKLILQECELTKQTFY